MSLPLSPVGALILASSSPRRSELLSRIGIPFMIVAPDVDETIEEQTPHVVRVLAQRKAHAAADALRDQGRGGIVLAADTIVWCEGEILGKPRDAQDAARMLGSISGRWHEVYTGVCMLDTAIGREETLIDCARVRISDLSAQEIMRYIATGEPMDKAGAYAIQGIGGMFIEEIAGSPSNVMGLPMAQTRRLLQQFGILE